MGGMRGRVRDVPDVNEFLGFVGGSEVVDVYDERVERYDLSTVLMVFACF